MASAPPRDCVLVVGAAHVDVIADYATSAGPYVDKPGLVHYAVGGTAYNIAINLGQEGIPVTLMTVLRRTTYPSVWIQERLDNASVGSSLIEFDPSKPDSGFVAIRREHEFETAVTATAVERHSFKAESIERAVAAARIVVLDCNLAPDQIASLVDAAQAANKPVAIAAVSDGKVAKLVNRSNKQLAVELVALNERELIAAGAARVPRDSAEARAACALLGTRRIVVTRGSSGHLVLGEGGEFQAYPAPTAGPIVSTTGAGDALLAAIVAAWYRRPPLDMARAQQTIVNIVGKVLAEEGATRGSIASEADLDLVTRWLERQRSFKQRWLTHETRLVAVGGLLVALLAWGFPRSQSGVESSPRPDAQAAAAAAAVAAAASALALAPVTVQSASSASASAPAATASAASR